MKCKKRKKDFFFEKKSFRRRRSNERREKRRLEQSPDECRRCAEICDRKSLGARDFRNELDFEIRRVEVARNANEPKVPMDVSRFELYRFSALRDFKKQQ